MSVIIAILNPPLTCHDQTEEPPGAQEQATSQGLGQVSTSLKTSLKS